MNIDIAMDSSRQTVREAQRSFSDGLKQRYPQAIINNATANDAFMCGFSGIHCKRSLTAHSGVILFLPDTPMGWNQNGYGGGIKIFDDAYKACMLSKVEASYLPYVAHPAPAKINF